MNGPARFYLECALVFLQAGDIREWSRYQAKAMRALRGV